MYRRNYLSDNKISLTRLFRELGLDLAGHGKTAPPALPANRRRTNASTETESDSPIGARRRTGLVAGQKSAFFEFTHRRTRSTVERARRLRTISLDKRNEAARAEAMIGRKPSCQCLLEAHKPGRVYRSGCATKMTGQRTGRVGNPSWSRPLTRNLRAHVGKTIL